MFPRLQTPKSDVTVTHDAHLVAGATFHFILYKFASIEVASDLIGLLN